MVRPGTEEFLRKMGELYEIVVFTASVKEYADYLDRGKAVSYRLYRDHCTQGKEAL